MLRSIALCASITRIAGVSPWAERIRQEIEILAQHDATVLITGPSGTGKELIARSIHELSRRAGGPFVPVDCASATGTLFTSQIFGHEKGAFTGATHASLGAFRAAAGGTIFLDEMGELEHELQAKLLRVLQERVVTPLGAVQPEPIDVRIIAATNRDLDAEVVAGRFREDLYYRLNVVNVRTEPLAARRSDLPILIDHLLSRLEVHHGIQRKPIAPEAMQLLFAYTWPGNVRELANVLERSHLYCTGPVIDVMHLPERLTHAADPQVPAEACSIPSPVPSQTWPTMDEVERTHLMATLERTNFNQSEAGRLLGLDRHALRRMAKRLGIDLSRSHPGRPRYPR